MDWKQAQKKTPSLDTKNNETLRRMQHGIGQLAQTLVLKMRSQVSRWKLVLPRWPIGRSRFVYFGGHFVFFLNRPVYFYCIFLFIINIWAV